MNLLVLNRLAERLTAKKIDDGHWKFSKLEDLITFNAIAIRIEGIEVSTSYPLMSCYLTKAPVLPYKDVLSEKLHELIRMCPDKHRTMRNNFIRRERIREKENTIKFPTAACCEFDCFGNGMTECGNDVCCDDNCTSQGFPSCTRDRV